MSGALLPLSAAVYHLSFLASCAVDFRVCPQQLKPGALYICRPALRFSAYLLAPLRRFCFAFLMLSPWAVGLGLSPSRGTVAGIECERLALPDRR